MSLKIVALEGFFCPIPKFELNIPEYTVKEYERTPYNDIKTLHERIHDADVVLITTFPLNGVALSSEFSPNLRLIVIMSVGTDCVDLEICKSRGIQVTNCPKVNAEAVAEHAITLMFAARRRVVETHQAMLKNEWQARESLFKDLSSPNGYSPPAWCDETVGIIGYGAIGKRIEAVCRSLGMRILIADRKKGSSTKSSVSGRHSFEGVLKQATTIFLCLPRSPDSLKLLSSAEFSVMQPSAVLVNVSRGGIVDEVALVEALQNGKISSAACDVFDIEPAGIDNSILVRTLVGAETNVKPLPLILTPHTAWYSQRTIGGLQDLTCDIVTGWCKGQLSVKYIVV